MSLSGVKDVSCISHSSGCTQDTSTNFRSHLAKALGGAADLTRGVSALRPGGTFVAAGLDGIARLLDPESNQPTASAGDLGAVLSDTKSVNGRYLELQARMQMESQAFTALSNVMKARHDSALTALNNIR